MFCHTCDLDQLLLSINIAVRILATPKTTALCHWLALDCKQSMTCQPCAGANTQTQATATTGGTVPLGSTPANTGSSAASQPSSSGGSSSGSSSSTSGPSTSTSLSTTGTVGVPITAVSSTPEVAAVTAPVVEAALAVFDGYLSNCQVPPLLDILSSLASFFASCLLCLHYLPHNVVLAQSFFLS